MEVKPVTRYHATYSAQELSRRHSLNDSEKLASEQAADPVDSYTFGDDKSFKAGYSRLAPNLPDKLAIQKKLRDIDKKRDEAWKGYGKASRHIEHQKDELLDTVEDRLKQTVEEKTLFTIRWSMN